MGLHILVVVTAPVFASELPAAVLARLTRIQIDAAVARQHISAGLG